MDEASADLLAGFRARAEPLGVVVHRAESVDDAATLLMAWEPAASADALVVAEELAARSPRLMAALEARGARLVLPGSPEDVRDAPVGLSLAHLAVAETGSALLSEPSLADRAVGLLTLAQTIVVPTELLVASLDEAAPVLRRHALAGQASMTTLVTGPSRTADIERVLTVGVQGPGKVMILFVDDL